MNEPYPRNVWTRRELHCPHCGTVAVACANPLTKRQYEILSFLQSYTQEHGYAPSFEEIAARFGYNSLATVHEHLTNLERKGYIARQYNEARSLVVLGAITEAK